VEGDHDSPIVAVSDYQLTYAPQPNWKHNDLKSTQQRSRWIDYLARHPPAALAHANVAQITHFVAPTALPVFMPREKPSPEPSFGFLSTLESPEYGYFGGYLIVSPLGRPLEFHCTSPVRPSRAQEILYGPTLQPYLLGEQISGALLQAANSPPRLVLTDSAEMLSSRSLASSPMALVLSRIHANATAMEEQGNEAIAIVAFASSADVSQLRNFDGQIDAGGYELLLPTGFEAEKHAVAELVAQLSQHVDLAEPFGRIHEAIREAQRIGGRTVEAYGQAA
jgi:hypothetical protein